MFLYGIKDVVAQAIIQVFPAKTLALVKRDLSSVVNDSNAKNQLARNSQDFQLFTLAEINEESGEVTPKLHFELNLADLKTNVN